MLKFKEHNLLKKPQIKSMEKLFANKVKCFEKIKSCSTLNDLKVLMFKKLK